MRSGIPNHAHNARVLIRITCSLQHCTSDQHTSSCKWRSGTIHCNGDCRDDTFSDVDVNDCAGEELTHTQNEVDQQHSGGSARGWSDSYRIRNQPQVDFMEQHHGGYARVHVARGVHFLLQPGKALQASPPWQWQVRGDVRLLA